MCIFADCPNCKESVDGEEGSNLLVAGDYKAVWHCPHCGCVFLQRWTKDKGDLEPQILIKEKAKKYVDSTTHLST